MIGWIKNNNGTVYLEMDKWIYTLLCCVVYGIMVVLVGYLTYLFSIENQINELGLSLKKDIIEIQTSNLYLKEKITSGAISLKQNAIEIAGNNTDWPGATASGPSSVYEKYILRNFSIKALSNPSPVDLLDYAGLGVILLAAVYLAKSFSLRQIIKR